jgi:acetyltransferase-like isoleucine patch superfamily enzyme
MLISEMGDSHSILNLETGKRVNWAKDIQIGRHVWLGAKTKILGGAEIGENAIIGIGLHGEREN